MFVFNKTDRGERVVVVVAVVLVVYGSSGVFFVVKRGEATRSVKKENIVSIGTERKLQRNSH